MQRKRTLTDADVARREIVRKAARIRREAFRQRNMLVATIAAENRRKRSIANKLRAKGRVAEMRRKAARAMKLLADGARLTAQIGVDMHESTAPVTSCGTTTTAVIVVPPQQLDMAIEVLEQLVAGEALVAQRASGV